MMGPRWSSLFPHVLRGNVYLYCYDLWDSNQSEWIRLIERARPLGLTANSLAAAEFYRHWFPHLPVALALEAIPDHWFQTSSSRGPRNVDVLQVGRLDASLHESLTSDPRAEDLNYLFPHSGMQSLRTNRAYAAALQSAKVVVTVTRASSHPEVAGSFPALTQRYWEVMASGALPWGDPIPELSDLAGYEPVVPISRKDPVGQLRAILDNFEHYQGLRRRNRELAQQQGTYARLADALIKDVKGAAGSWR